MRAIIFANGEINEHDDARNLLIPGDTLIAADGGARHCISLGVTPSFLVGDFDSLSEAEVDDWAERGVKIMRHDPRKDETDLELALLLAQGMDHDEAIVLGALGGRWDQTFANLLLPAYEKLSGLKVSFWHDGLWIYLVRGHREIHGKAGQTLSLLPIGGDVEGVTTTGLEYPLEDETLKFGASRGVSNLLLGEIAEVSIRSGLLLCFVFAA